MHCWRCDWWRSWDIEKGWKTSSCRKRSESIKSGHRSGRGEARSQVRNSWKCFTQLWWWNQSSWHPPGTKHQSKTKSNFFLQELVVSRGWRLPDYSLASEAGPAHKKEFIICCAVEKLKEYGNGSSKKAAKRNVSQYRWFVLKPYSNLLLGSNRYAYKTKGNSSRFQRTHCW